MWSSFLGLPVPLQGSIVGDSRMCHIEVCLFSSRMFFSPLSLLSLCSVSRGSQSDRLSE
jgi:hypothetical protein